MEIFSLIPAFETQPAALVDDSNTSRRQAETQGAMLRISQRYMESCEFRTVEHWNPNCSLWPTSISLAVLRLLKSSRLPLPAPAFLGHNPLKVILSPKNLDNLSGNETTELGTSNQDAARNDESQPKRETYGSPPLEVARYNVGPHGKDPEGTPPPEDPHNLTRSFNLYEQTKSTRELNEAIKMELLKTHPATEGCIYGFLHPGNVFVRIGTGPISDIQIIKIGRSVKVQRRMKEWKKKCKYEPRVVFNAKMPHHRRIERIVHHQLHNSRLREYPGCSGCNVQHTEWFRVSTIYAEHLVRMWQAFAQRRPYSENGDLLPDWLERLERIDLEDPGCWMWFILGNPSIGPVFPLDNAEDQHAGPSV